MKEGETTKYEIKTVEGTGPIITDFKNSAVTVIEIISGSPSIFVGTERTEADSGTYIIIPAGQTFRIDSGEKISSARLVTFDEDALQEYMEKIDRDLYYMFVIQSRGKIPTFSPEHPAYELIAYSASEIFDEYAAKDICWGLSVRANVYMLFSAVMRHYFSERNQLDRMVYHNVLRLRPALDYISDHCGDKIYIDTLAEMLSVSPDYFTKMFRDSIGKTPIDYINAVRVNRALELLSVTEVPLSEIAEMSGFANANYFHKIFKSYMETSPLAYRKSSKQP